MDTPTDRVAIVTGAARGIGLAIAQRFLSDGARVILTDKDEKQLRQTLNDLGTGASGIAADVSKPDELDEVYALARRSYGHVHAVVANAGIGDHAPLSHITEAQIDRTFGTDVKGVIFTVQKALPLMINGGAIVVIGSTASIHPPAGMSVYGGAKAAVRAMIRAWIQDVRGTGVRINMLSPGAVDLPSLRRGLTEARGHERLDDAIRAMGEANPLGRLAYANEIAAAAAYLCSDQASFITGVELFVDGGLAQV